VSLTAIVPVKPFAEAKTRLRRVLSDEERCALARAMLARTLSVIGRVGEIRQTLVVSRDPQALEEARGLGARPLLETGAGDLNAALREASEEAVREGADAILVIPADLPLLTLEDVRALVDLRSRPPVIVVAPDRLKRGTNALLLSPPALIEYSFGDESFGRHVAQAEASGARLEICESPGLRLDVDGPDDLAMARLADQASAWLPGE
jgi:2-phospho-L-lactate guanylyltransferase